MIIYIQEIFIHLYLLLVIVIVIIVVVIIHLIMHLVEVQIVEEEQLEVGNYYNYIYILVKIEQK